MSDSSDVEGALTSARRELSPVKARHILHGALKKARALPPSPQLAILMSAASTELAELESNADRRLELRKRAITVLVGAKIDSTVGLVVGSANRRVDLSYDVFAGCPIAEVRHELAAARRDITTTLHTDVTPRERALLLAQQASVLRAQARLAHGFDRKRSLDESLRCARAAVDADNTSSPAMVELGQSLWACARWADSESTYFRDMNDAQVALAVATKQRDPLAWLVSARFFRQTYRPQAAIERFKTYADIDPNRRRVLRECHIACEAAMQLWFSGYDDAVTDDALLFARAAGRDALEAGYENARIIVDLALIEATRGDSTLAEATLRRLAIAPSSSWIDIVTDAIEHVHNGRIDRILNTFVVGLADSHAWNGLGTFAAAISKDNDLAIRLYDVARKLDPTNPVVLTNLARKLMVSGDSDSLALADKYLTTAAANADQSFVWWQSLRADLRMMRGDVVPLVRIPTPTTFKELVIEFRSLSVDEPSSGERGDRFEKLVARLLTLIFKDGALGSHHVANRQVDAAFRHDGIHYRVECKWHSRPLGETDIDDFARRLDAAETRGIFLSMSGYTEAAIQHARRIGENHVLLLFGADDIADIFTGGARFESILERKLSWFQRFTEPYDVAAHKTARRRRTVEAAPSSTAG